MIVADIMTRELVTVPREVTVRAALDRAHEHDIHHLLVVESGRLSGVVCVCQLLDEPNARTLQEVRVEPPEVIWPESSLASAAQRFVEKGVSCFPVCDGAELVGVITRADLRCAPDDTGEVPMSFDCEHCGGFRN